MGKPSQTDRQNASNCTKDNSVSDEKVITVAKRNTAPTFNFEPGQLDAFRGTGFDLIPLHVPNALDSRGRKIGKAPHKGWRKHKALTVDEAIAHMGDSNVGVRLAADDLVIDVDPRNFAEGDDPLARLVEDTGLDLSKYPTVVTGSGGKHIYMKMPAGTLTRDTIENYPGVEFKAIGRQVVAPGSVHPDALKPYLLTSGDLSNVPEAPEALIGTILRPDRTSVEGGGEYSPEWLSSTLELLDPADFRDHSRWLEIMMACHHATAGEARDEFVEWSTSDPQYSTHDILIGRRWDSLHSDKGGRQITVKTLFKELNKVGVASMVDFQPDAATVAADFPDDLEPEPAAAEEVEREALTLEDFVGSTEYVVDGFLPVGVGVIAGAWGAGKTVNLIPLLATAAHVTPKDWTVKHAELRRHVVFVGEDMGQIKSAIGALSMNPGAAPLAEILKWVHFFQAKRLTPEALAARVKALADRFTYSNEHGYPIRPVVVLDTANANCELESENDSRAVGQMMSALKGAKVPTIIVGHVAKAITRSEFAAHSFRGSGAFEADADFTAYLLHDEATDDRYLGVHKVRFAPEFREVAFDTYAKQVSVPVEWDPNKRQERTILNGVPKRSSKIDRQEGAKKKHLDEFARTILEAVEDSLAGESGALPHPLLSAVKGLKDHRGEKVAMGNALRVKAIDELVAGEDLVKHDLSHLTLEERRTMGLPTKGPAPTLLLPKGRTVAAYVARKLGREVEDPLDQEFAD